MRYGIQENENGLMCANCLNILSVDGKVPFDYCPYCGNALTDKSIAGEEKKQLDIEKNIFYTLRDISEELKTDSLKKCMKEYFKDKI